MENNIFNINNPLILNKELAQLVGEKDSIVLQQLHYWVSNNEKKDRKSYFKKGIWWTHNTYEEWHEEFPFWSLSTIKRIFARLKKRGAIIIEKINKKRYDQTNWYRIDYDLLGLKMSQSSDSKMNQSTEPNLINQENQVDTIIDSVKESQSYIKTKEINKETIFDNKKKQGFKNIIENYTSNEKLRDRIRGFIKLRQALKCPMVDDSLKLIVENLSSLANNDEDKIKILENSIANSYRNIYPLNKPKTSNEFKQTKTKSNYKNYNNSKKELKFNNFDQRSYDYKKLEEELLESSMSHQFGQKQNDGIEQCEKKEEVIETQEVIDIEKKDYDLARSCIQMSFGDFGYNYKFSEKDVILIASTLIKKFGTCHVGFFSDVRHNLKDKNDMNLAKHIVDFINSYEKKRE